MPLISTATCNLGGIKMASKTNTSIKLNPDFDILCAQELRLTTKDVSAVCTKVTSLISTAADKGDRVGIFGKSRLKVRLKLMYRNFT